MKFVIISGSHRQPSQSSKVAGFIQRTLKKKYSDADVEIIDLGGNPFPLWDQTIWEGDEAWKALLANPKKILSECDALVVISPEWHGQVPAGLKNFFLLFGPAELGHKPAMIVTVSSGEGGAYPVAELRMSSYKNNRICYIPEHVVVKNAENVLNEEGENEAEGDAYLRGRIDWSLSILNEYAKALKPVRDSGLTTSSEYPFGM